MKAPHELFEIYNDAMTVHGLDPLPELWLGNLRYRLAILAEWCREQDIDPERWIWAKHASVRWRHRITITQLAKSTPEFLSNFREWGDSLQGERVQQMDWDTRSIEDTDWSGPQLVVCCERAKKAYFHSKPLCLKFSMTLTGGWNPRSAWCQLCQEANECQSALPDFVVVRRQLSDWRE